AHHDGGRLLRVRAGPHPEIDDGPRHPELAEEHLGHRLVVVLAGVDQLMRDAGPLEGAVDRRRLHEVRPGAHHGVDHGCASAGAGATSDRAGRPWAAVTMRPMSSTLA